MTTILSLTSSFKFVVKENTPRRGAKRSEFINQYEPNKQKTFNSGRTFRFQSELSIGKTNLSRQMEDFVSYVESGSVEKALQLFDEMNERSSFLWNLIIRVLTNSGFFEEALDLYFRMSIEGTKADNFTFPFVIKACGGCLDHDVGRKIHSKLFKDGLDLDLHISNSLILMYAKLGCIGSAEKVFDEMPIRDLVSWNSMINGYIMISDGLASFMCVRKMQQYNMRPDRFTIMSTLHASSLVCSLPKGKEIHALTIKSKLECNPMVQTSLIDMYGKCGGMCYAERFFNMISQRHIASWNAMIRGYALNGRPLESFSCLRKMQENGCKPDNVSLINLLLSCSQVGSVLMGKTVHGYAIRMEFLSHIVLETALIDMYGKCGEPRLAELAFNRMHQRNLISRNTLIASLVQNGLYKDALKFFWDIWNDGLKPDAMTITGILPVYSEIAQLREGKQLHGYIVKSGFCSNTFVLNSLTYMYAKCGDLVSARDMFDGIFLKDVISWNTIIMAYAIHGYGEVSVKLFSKMKKMGIKPNASTFVSLLSSCSVSGMVEEGWKYFNSMKSEYGIDPDIEHYGCMLDLLGRVGDLNRAKQLITEMPLEPTSRIWGSLLAASRRHRDLEVAEFAAKKMLPLEHDNTGLYVLLSNLYAETGRWEDVKRIKSLMKSRGLTKTVGVTMVDVKGKTFRFTNEDRSHEHSHLIYDVLDIILKNPRGDLSKFKPIDLLRKMSKSTDRHSVRLARNSGWRFEDLSPFQNG
ncbi:Pentatricopeptide repeat-containing protein [Cynara cardunculus var. scolymus]|uniref:Pentatricopeptide repeat-containing protein n=1 Tax=Cynara cardunculus var. scolymus TaxID=59895 RepID=A0A118JX89_CYNCS|nr:Pentatricopeptide repeat-containing protein [Cynara cardunculus var. scolymus]